MNLHEFLKRRNVRFEPIHHAPAGDASRLAETVHVPGALVAKTVLLRADAGFVIAIVPSTRHVDLDAMRAVLGCRMLELASEEDAATVFTDVERGVVPPFGSQYGLRTIVDAHLVASELVVFEGSTHEDAIRMTVQDFQMLENAQVGLISAEGFGPRRVRGVPSKQSRTVS